MKIVIAGASGNIGQRTAEKVIQAGAETILLARHPEKLSALVAQGATVKPISSDDTIGLIEATQNADALFWLTPPKLDTPSLRDWYIQTAMAGASSVRENGLLASRQHFQHWCGCGAKLGDSLIWWERRIDFQPNFLKCGASAPRLFHGEFPGASRGYSRRPHYTFPLC